MPPEIPDPKPQLAWRWVPSLYFCQGMPNVVMTSLSVVMFKNLNVSNADITFYTSMPYLPWVIKPLWSPLVEMFGKKRWWIVSLQFVIGIAFATVALLESSSSPRRMQPMDRAETSRPVLPKGLYRMVSFLESGSWFEGVTKVIFVGYLHFVVGHAGLHARLG